VDSSCTSNYDLSCSCIDSPLSFAASCSPVLGSTPSTEMPPVLNLHTHPVEIPVLDSLSCTICPRPDRSGIRKQVDPTSAAPNSPDHILTYVQRTHLNSDHTTAKKFSEKAALLGEEGGALWKGLTQIWRTPLNIFQAKVKKLSGNASLAGKEAVAFYNSEYKRNAVSNVFLHTEDEQTFG